jgi:hypothetical protein
MNKLPFGRSSGSSCFEAFPFRDIGTVARVSQNIPVYTGKWTYSCGYSSGIFISLKHRIPILRFFLKRKNPPKRCEDRYFCLVMIPELHYFFTSIS